MGTLTAVHRFGLRVESGTWYRCQYAVEGTLHRVPLVSTICDASKQLTSMFDRKNEDAKAMRLVLCTFVGDGGTAALALLPNSFYSP